MNEMRKILNLFENTEQEDLFFDRMKFPSTEKFYRHVLEKLLDSNEIVFGTGHDLKDTYIDSTAFDIVLNKVRQKIGTIEDEDLLEKVYYHMMEENYIERISGMDDYFKDQQEDR